MTRVTKILMSSAGLAAVLLPTAGIAGGTMTRADFERCNQVAMQAAGVSSPSPSASPTTSGTGASGSITSGSTGTTGSSSTGLSASSPSGNPVSSPGSGTASSPSAGTSSSPTVSGSGSSVSGSTAVSGGTDPQLERAVQAYRDCLRS